MASPGVSLDNAINGLNAGIEQARKAAGQLVRDSESSRPTATKKADEPEEATEFEPDETVGTRINVTV